MTNPTVLEMVAAALRAGKYDGLYNAENECGCELKDLAPCEGIGHDCQAGFKQKWKERGIEWWRIGAVAVDRTKPGDTATENRDTEPRAPGDERPIEPPAVEGGERV